jgi:16S rRNA (adenine1518-N6/adenine1519-N6)-dimethyltransferase
LTGSLVSALVVEGDLGWRSTPSQPINQSTVQSMQTQTEIRRLLSEAGLAPNKALGQNFLIDGNLMGRLLELADVQPADTVLEVGPGTGSLTEELARRARSVVAVELDRGLHALLRGRLADRANVTLLHEDILAGKHAIRPAVLEAAGERAVLVSNVPYRVATPLVAECLLMSWRCAAGAEGTPPRANAEKTPATRFDRLTFTVQREVADRMSARPGEEAYGPLSVIVALLGRLTLGPLVPASAFWPPPKVASRILRIDFDAPRAARLADAEALTSLLAAAFAQRRKQLASLLRRKAGPFAPARLAAAFQRAGVDLALRAERVGPEQFLSLAGALVTSGTAGYIGGS